MQNSGGSSGAGSALITSPGDSQGKGMTSEMLEQFEGLKKDVMLFKKKNLEIDNINLEVEEKLKKLRSVLIDLQANQQTKEELKKANEERDLEKQEREKTNSYLHKTIMEIKEISKQVEDSLSFKINKEDLDNSNEIINREMEKIVINL